MRIISSVKKERAVKAAVRKVSDELNDKLSRISGRISEINAKIDVGFSGATVRLVVIVDREKVRSKKIFWANKGSSNEKEALRLAEKEMNPKIENISGEIADSHIQFVSPPIPQRVYVTMIAGVNEKVPEKVGKLSTDERRARLSEILLLVDNEPKAINISKIAQIFEVSRDTIYKDLTRLGHER
ncbi:hypothetical protein AKJ39_04625 [candidate division MSBL1 archaeon SCGC-AAA259J03]|uniref:Helix-turn-helix type 11 domain-containing protein n=1 Tax=candidate division MSBL1 archaeon SCGC-AAA259J03 TaxID=1698269 RepID=A0A656YWS5_9EURY|nr:hypothetical protein AKJ39_04625 [candidate division MSBL1 archaeon SCGC-AAA259J03]